MDQYLHCKYEYEIPIAWKELRTRKQGVGCNYAEGDCCRLDASATPHRRRSPLPQVRVSQPLTKQRTAVGQHVGVEQLGGSHIVEPCKGYTVTRPRGLKVQVLTIRPIKSNVTPRGSFLKHPTGREFVSFGRNTQHWEAQTMTQDRHRVVNHYLLRQLNRGRTKKATSSYLPAFFLVEAVLPVLQPQHRTLIKRIVNRKARTPPSETVTHLNPSVLVHDRRILVQEGHRIFLFPGCPSLKEPSKRVQHCLPPLG